MYDIDKDIPIPPAHLEKYPWRAMKVGDSFAVADKGTGQMASTAASRSKLHKGERYRVRSDGYGGCRVWRIA